VAYQYESISIDSYPSFGCKIRSYIEIFSNSELWIDSYIGERNYRSISIYGGNGSLRIYG
jgi:hypothetical protein